MSELTDKAAALRTLFEAHAGETDTLRRLPDANVTAIKDAGLCRLRVPKRFGGHETNIHTYIEVMEELGRGCGSTSWVASLINVCAWLTSLFPDQAQQDVWGTNRAAWVAKRSAVSSSAWPRPEPCSAGCT